MKLMHSCNHVSWQMQQPLATMANSQGWPIDHPYAPDHGCQADSQRAPHLVVLTPASSHACPQGKWKRRDPSFSFLWDCCEDSTKMLVLIRSEHHSHLLKSAQHLVCSAQKWNTTILPNGSAHHGCAVDLQTSWLVLTAAITLRRPVSSYVKLFMSPNKHHTWWQGSARTNCNPGHPIIQKTVALRCLFWSFMLSLVLGLLHKQRAPMNWTTCFGSGPPHRDVK